MISESTLLVRPEHLNHHGYLFGGRLLEWLDEQAYIGAIANMKEGTGLVTVSIDRVQFKHQVRNGSALKFQSRLVHVGRTSMTMHTDVIKLPGSEVIFSASVTFVALGSSGKPVRVAPLLLKAFKPETPDEKRWFKEVEDARKQRGKS